MASNASTNAANVIVADMKQYIDERDTEMSERVETRVKAWIFRAVLVQVFSFLPAVFFLGGIYFQNNAALEMLREQQVRISANEQWMAQRERWEQAVEQQWPGKSAFMPPRSK